MHGHGEYTDRKAEIEAHPPVNISRTYLKSLESRRYLYDVWAASADHLARADLDLHNFPMSPTALVFRSSDYDPFYLLDPGYWPSIFADEGFHIVNRDEGIGDHPHVTVLGAPIDA